MKGKDYMHEAKNVSSVLGRNSDVKVVFEGTGACTDGNNIVLPTIDSEVELDDWTVKVARGYVDHEAAHVKWTDQDQWVKAINRFKRSKEHVALKKGCLNALEDMRIEKKLIDMYAGSIDNLDAVSTEVINELILSMGKRTKTVTDLSAVEIGGLAATWYGRVKHGYGQVAGEYFELLDQELQDVVKGAVDRLDSVSDTKGVVKIAEEIRVMMTPRVIRVMIKARVTRVTRVTIRRVTRVTRLMVMVMALVMVTRLMVTMAWRAAILMEAVTPSSRVMMQMVRIKISRVMINPLSIVTL